MKRRMIAWLLTLCLCVSLCPPQVLAEGEDIPETGIADSNVLPQPEQEEPAAPSEEPEQEPEEAHEENTEEEPAQEPEPIVCTPVEETVALLADTVISQGTCGANATWVLYANGTLKISGTGATTNVGWADYKENIITVEVEYGITGLGSNAFSNCVNLTGVTLPDSVTSIGYSAFSGCKRLISLTLPDGVTSIANYAFQDCTGLAKVSVGKGVATIGYEVFRGCVSLAAIVVDAENASFASVYGVLYNKAMTQLICCPANYPGSSFAIPAGVTGISRYAFKNCVGLTGVTLPDSVTSIDGFAFSGCSRLTDLIIPDSVTSIGGYAFEDCTSLAKVSIGKGVAAIGSRHFSGCDSLAAIVVDAENASFAAVDGVLYNKAMTQLIRCPANYPGSSFAIPAGVTGISEYAFQNCVGLTGVTLPDSVTSIDQYAFSGCSRLTDLTIPDSVTNIGQSAFSGCGSLESITLPFVGYSKELSEDLYFYPMPFFMVFGGDSSPAYTYVRHDCHHITSGASLWLSSYLPNSLKSVTITGGGIYYGAFGNCTTLTSITISDAITLIEEGSFDGVTAELRYPCNSPLTEAQRTNYGGELTWVMYHNENTVSAQEPTCTEPGMTEGRSCKACKVVLAAQETVPAKGHTEVEDAAAAATCTEPGKTAGRHCETCGQVLIAQETIPATGHKEVSDEAVAATCTESGKTAGRHCETCGEVLIAQETIPATGHKEVPDEAVAATCTEPGKTAGTHCETCGEVLIAQETVPSKGHKEVPDEAVAATCTESGKTAGTHCETCGQVLTAQEIIPAVGHREAEDAAVAANCTEPGKTAGTHCETCGEVLAVQEEIPALGHDFSHGRCSRCETVNYAVVVTGPESVIGGKSVTLEAVLEPSNLTGTGLLWEITEGEDFAAVTGSNMVAVLKTKAVTENQTVTVTITTADGEAVPGEYTITLTPYVSSVRIRQDDAVVTGKTIKYNLRGEPCSTITFSAASLPVDAAKDIRWTSSDTKNALCIVKDNGDGTITIYPIGKAGTVTLTATAADGSKKKATVKVQFTKYALPGELEILGLPGAELQGRQTVTLKTSLATLPGLSDRKVVWSLGAGESAYASVTSAGKLTVNEVGKEVVIHVTAAASANPAATATAEITLKPLDKATTSEIRILHEGAVVNNSTLVLDTGTGEPLQLSAEVYPAGAGIIWKSSSAKVATVNADGVVTGIKAGTVSITAMADDGSKVYGSVKVTVQANVYAVTVSNAPAEGKLSVTGGKSLTLKAAFEPAKPTNSKVTWSLRPEDAPYATISSTGVLKAAKVTGIHTVQATVTSQADPAVTCTVAVTIYPAATAVNITMDGLNVSGAKLTHSLSNGTELQLAARTSPYLARNDVTWKTSSAKLATVDETGKITFTGVTGKVTITCTAADGSGKKTTITFTVTK